MSLNGDAPATKGDAFPALLFHRHPFCHSGWPREVDLTRLSPKCRRLYGNAPPLRPTSQD